MLIKFAFIAVMSLSAGFGTTVVASGAGALPATAEDLRNQFPTTITGSLAFPYGVSMFEINVAITKVQCDDG